LLGTATPSSFSLALSLSLLAALVLGGLGSLWGAFWGALALVYLELAGKELADLLGLSSSVADNVPLVFFGTLLIVIVIAWPMRIPGVLGRFRGVLRRRRAHPFFPQPSPASPGYPRRPLHLHTWEREMNGLIAWAGGILALSL